MAGENDVLTRNENEELAVRVVNTTESSTVVNPNDVYTRDTNGNLAVRTVGGGGDQHNLGYFATLQALQEAYPTAEAGDFAIVGTTDTVWIWDTDTSAWVDSDQKGQVTSVNNQTGAVVLTASDVGAATTAQGTKADTAVQPADLATVATTGDYDDLTNKPTIPAAQVNSDWDAVSGVAQILNKPTLGTMAAESASDYTKTANLATVATTGAYSDLSGTPTIPTVNNATLTITQGGTTKGTFTANAGTDVTIDVDAGGSSLPTQTGNAGKFLTTDGTDASWGNTLTTSVYIDKVDDTTRTYIMPNFIYLYDDKSNTTNRIGMSSGWISGSDFGDSGVYENIILDGRRGSKYGAVLGRSNYMLKAVFTEKLVNGSYVITLPNKTGTMALINTPSTMPTLAVADWSNNTQTVNVTGVTATNTVFVSPAPASAADYASAGIVCTAQGAGTLTFTCTTTPTNAITVNVVCL